MSLIHTDAPPFHGGRLVEAAKAGKRPLSDWIDLSTGLNPEPYPLPAIPDNAFQRLPEYSHSLAEACEDFLKAPSFAVSGSQRAIEHLPLLYNPSRVGVFSPMYAEHAFCWRKYGHHVYDLELDNHNSISQTRILILVNPNNPTTRVVGTELIEALRRIAQKNDGLLIVDEAFIDTCNEFSALSLENHRHLVVLRSIGKFFGLAGIRAGLVSGDERILNRLKISIGPWDLSGPASYLLPQLLTDFSWQETTRKRLKVSAGRLVTLLSREFNSIHKTDYFAWLPGVDPIALEKRFKQAGILIRTFPKLSGIRVGLPGPEEHWLRLEETICG